MSSPPQQQQRPVSPSRPNCRHSSQINCIDCRSHQQFPQRRRISSTSQQPPRAAAMQPAPPKSDSVAMDGLAARLQRSLRVTSMSIVASISMMPLRPAPRNQQLQQQRRSLSRPQPEPSSRTAPIVAAQHRVASPPPPPTPPPPTRPTTSAPNSEPRDGAEAAPKLRPAAPDDAAKYRRSHLAAVSARKSSQFTRILRLRQKRRRRTFDEVQNDKEMDELVRATTDAAFVSSAATNSPFYSYFEPLPRYRERGRDILSLVKPPRDRFRERTWRRRQPTAEELAYGGFEPGDFLYERAAGGREAAEDY